MVFNVEEMVCGKIRVLGIVSDAILRLYMFLYMIMHYPDGNSRWSCAK